MTTIEDKFTEWWTQRSVTVPVEQRQKFREAFYYGASSALVTILKGNAPRTVDARKIHFTVLEMTGHRHEQDGRGAWQPPANDPRETTLAKELTTADEPDIYKDSSYAGAHAALQIIVDPDYRVDVAKIPLLVREVGVFIESLDSASGDLQS